MTIAQNTSKLMRTLERYAQIIKQEVIIRSEEENARTVRDITQKVEEVEKRLDIDVYETARTIEKILDGIHKVCTNKIQEQSAETAKTIVVKHKNKKCVLSKSIPRPQIDFKDTSSKYRSEREADGRHGSAHSHTGAQGESYSERADVHAKYAALVRECNTGTEETQSTYIIATEEQMARANTEIEKETVIGVDVKTHTFRSYSGFICYIVVATCNAVYIYDMIQLRNRIAEMRYMTSENVVKVMYKAKEKRQWIEQAMCSTMKMCMDIGGSDDAQGDRTSGDANKTSKMSSTSLQRIVHKHTGVNVQREYAVIDWRYRNTTQEMKTQMLNDIRYVREIGINMMKSASKDEYKCMIERTNGHVQRIDTVELFAEHYKVELTKELREIYKLREFIAKQEDESTSFVLTNRQLIAFVQKCPVTPEETFKILPKISPLFKANLNNFLRSLNLDKKPSSFSMHVLKKK